MSIREPCESGRAIDMCLTCVFASHIRSRRTDEAMSTTKPDAATVLVALSRASRADANAGGAEGNRIAGDGTCEGRRELERAGHPGAEAGDRAAQAASAESEGRAAAEPG